MSYPVILFVSFPKPTTSSTSGRLYKTKKLQLSSCSALLILTALYRQSDCQVLKKYQVLKNVIYQMLALFEWQLPFCLAGYHLLFLSRALSFASLLHISCIRFGLMGFQKLLFTEERAVQRSLEGCPKCSVFLNGTLLVSTSWKTFQ